MNLVLFDTREEASLLAPADLRARHVREVLRMGQGDEFFVGLVNGPRGKAVILEDGPSGMALRVAWEEKTDASQPLCALVGLPRPQTARDVLREAATLGVAQLWFFRPEKGEPSYADSRLWTGPEWQTLLRRGAEQAFSTILPEVRHFADLQTALAALPAAATRIGLDVYEGAAPFSRLAPVEGPLALAIGSERGWSSSERACLCAAKFTLAHLGPRVLRTESALVAGFSVWMAARGLY